MAELAWSPVVWILLLAGAAAFAFVLLVGGLAALWWFWPAPEAAPVYPAAANNQQARERGAPNPGTEKAGNLLVNGSFEDGPDPGPGRFLTLNEGSTAIKGWVVTRGQIDYNGTYWQAADGQRSLDLQGMTGFTGGVKQTFPTRRGQRYRVTFALAGNPEGPPVVKTMEVEAAGQKKAFTFNTTGKNVRNMGWVTETWEFTAIADETTIEFYAPMTQPAGWGPTLDNVSVVAVTP